MKYDTNIKRIRFIRKGKIITFKQKQRLPNGREFKQMLIRKVTKNRDGSVEIDSLGTYIYYPTMKDLIKAIDWSWMERWHIK